jgi:hypothetical protein
VLAAIYACQSQGRATYIDCSRASCSTCPNCSTCRDYSGCRVPPETRLFISALKLLELTPWSPATTKLGQLQHPIKVLATSQARFHDTNSAGRREVRQMRCADQEVRTVRRVSLWERSPILAQAPVLRSVARPIQRTQVHQVHAVNAT